MIYEEKKNNAIYFYNVTYDKEKLKKILERLDKYSYVTIGKGQIAGNITRWPATKKNIQKRVSSIFYTRERHSNHTLLPETIVHHTENDCDFVTYEYSFKKLPDLYHYIDIIVNNKNIMNCANLFAYATGNLDMFYALAHKDQLVLEGLLNYINSPELVNHNSKNDTEISNQKYDYKGLNELYKETLECFSFKLIAIKEFVDNQEVISGLSLQRKKVK